MKAIIMAGGKGTRIASITNDEIPKPMLMIGEKPIIEHQIKCFKANGIKDITIIVGHLGKVISDYFGDGEKFGVNIDYISEDENNPLGTAGSLYYLANKIKEDFILVFGDVFFDVNFDKMIGFHNKNKAIATLLTHPNSHPFDSDLLVVDSNNVVIGFDSKENDRSNYDYDNIVNSGIYILSPVIFEKIKEPTKMSLEKDVIVKYIDQGKIYAYHSTEYVKDMGTPERYVMVNRDYQNNIPAMRNLKKKQKCIFLDRDGTINKYKGYILKEEELELIDGVAEAIRLINNSEYICIIVTNQPIIARGDCDEEKLENIHRHLKTMLGNKGAYVDDIIYCPHHPDSGFKGEIKELKIDCNCRKPKTGMVEEAAKKYNIDLGLSYIVGDSWRDIEMGHNANMKTGLVDSGEQNDEKELKFEYRANNLLEIIKMIIER